MAKEQVTVAAKVAENIDGKAPRGKCVSGRVWKKVQTQRFSSIKFRGTKVLKSTWDEKMEKRKRLKEIKELSAEIAQRKRNEIEEKKRLKEEREKRRAENEFKSAQVQVITKTHKLKGMSKKQLRNIKKTRMNNAGVVEYVGVYD